MSSDTTTRTYRVDASSTRGGAASITTKTLHLPFDAAAGQGDELPGPADLLTAAFAACVLKNVERFSEILPFSYDRASITVDSERQDHPPRIVTIRYELQVVTDEDDHRLALLHRNIQRHGTIFNTLAAVCDVQGEITAEPMNRP